MTADRRKLPLAPGSLRGRLVLSTFLICLLAVLASDWLDAPGRWRPPPDAPAWLRALATEPYQDGIVLGSFTLALLALLWAVSAWTLRPLIRASEEASEVGPRNPQARISGASLPTELRPLAQAMNGALDRLADALHAEQRFVANAAHELRTPLAVLDLRLRRARETGHTDWQALGQDLEALTRRVTQLLDLARAERGETPVQRLNLARIAREAAASVLPLIEARSRALAVNLPATLEVQGRAGALHDMVRNLLENALRHGSGTISLSGTAAAGEAILLVADEGPGIEEAEREAMFERFRTGATGGAGLGLAIVREVARAHGGRAAFLGGPGCRAEVRLPAAPAA